MPTYTVTSANLTLTEQQEADIAAAITRAHHESTGAPAYFAQVMFQAIAKGKHYIGGKPYGVTQLFVLGLIRAGRSAEVKSRLVSEIAARVHEIAGIGREDVWVYLQDIAATQMVEFGRILPEPGAEAAWRDAMGAAKLQDLKASGAL